MNKSLHSFDITINSSNIDKMDLPFELLFDENINISNFIINYHKNTIKNTTYKKKNYQDSSPKWYKIIENSYEEKKNSFSPRELNN